MPDGVLTLQPGARLWFEGEVWEVDCFLAEQARLRRGASVRLVSTSALLAAATPLDEQLDTTQAGPFVLPAVALAALTAIQRREVDQKVEQLRPLLGPVPDGSSRTEQIAAQARTLGVSVRTLERRLERFEALGPAGLVDARLLKETRRAVDPLWDTACRQILDSFVTESTPTRKTVIARANRAFLEASPTGKPPSARVAYAGSMSWPRAGTSSVTLSNGGRLRNVLAGRWAGYAAPARASSSSWTPPVWMCSPWSRSLTGG